MIISGFIVGFLLAFGCTATETSSEDEIPFVVASQGSVDEGKTSNLLPESSEEPPLTAGRSDIEIEQDRPFVGYFYPKPSRPFYLPPFKALGADGATDFADGAARPARSPQRWNPRYRPPPPFIPGFIPPNQIRPLPALYGRPLGY